VNHDIIQQHYDRCVTEARARREKAERRDIPTIHIGMATCGLAAGAGETRKAFEEALRESGIEARIHAVGCLGHCYAEPIAIIDHPASGFPPIFYHEVSPGKARMLTKMFLEGGDPRFEHVYGATVVNDMIPSVNEFARFNRETRIVLEKCGRISPDDIHEYIAEGGYGALARALSLSPESVTQEIRSSGLRGRGGAGFPTGEKWAAAREKPGERIVICNADEGDPGAYMDRTILESNPHQVLEGIIICAFAVQAQKAIIYVRAEYPLAVRALETAISQARSLNLVGPDILGSQFSLELSIFQGSGAFVCGEETGMIRSLEGFRGMPEHRPPYPAQSGLYGKPTVINNVKTLATIPPIIERGAKWFRSIGTPTSPGTAIFYIVGNVIQAGLVEIPMGITLRELIFDICGGIPGQKKFKAVQIGGPSGGCLSEAHLDAPIDFDSLKAAGAMMGSGGMVVMDEHTCVVNIARYFLEFTQRESCGKCTFCRIGTRHMLDILERLTCGKAQPNDLELLEELAILVSEGSLCGLGKTAPNPVLTSLKYFRQEYEAHAREGRCPSMMCRPLTAFYIDLDTCMRGCDACAMVCPTDAIFTTSTRKKGIDQSLCVKCGECMVACPPEYDAVRRLSPPQGVPLVEKPVTPIESSQEPST